MARTHPMATILALACLLFVTPTARASSFDLPIELECQGESSFHTGAAACAMPWGGKLKMRVKTPPTRGQLRVVDCDQVLTNGGNPDDFNMVLDKVGFWLWQRKVIRLDDPPEFVFPIRNFNDCPVVVSVAGEKAGVQSAVVLVDHRFHSNPKQLQNFLTYSCAGPIMETVNGLAVCKGLEGSRFAVKTQRKYSSGSMVMVGTGCGISRTVSLTLEDSIEVFLPEGTCVVDVGLVTNATKFKSRFLLIGEDRSIRKIDSPVMVSEGSNRRIYRPQGANLGATEIYLNEKVLWRSGSRNDESYVIRPDKDNGPGMDRWPDGAIACNTAYAEDIDSISGSCYDLRTMVEKPFYFK